MLSRYIVAILSLVCLTSLSCLQAQELVREALSVEVNSSFTEMRPLISEDGQLLYFGRSGHPANSSGKKDLQDVYVVQKQGLGWGESWNLGKPINNKYANSLGSISPDGQELLLVNTYNINDGPLVKFKRNGDGWLGPEPVVIDDFQNSSDYIDFFQSYRENVLLLAVETKGGRGEQDLYVCFERPDGSWSKPKNLGPAINTKKSDFAPFLAADGRTLFFASYGLKGMGGADLYYTTRLDDSWTKWSAPVNLGNPINTSGEETYCSVTADGSGFYYVSYLPGSPVRDIYRSALQHGTLSPETAVPVEMISINTQVNDVQTLQASATVSDEQPVTLQRMVNAVNPEKEVASPETKEEKVSASVLSFKKSAPAQVNAVADTSGPLKIGLKHKAVASNVPLMLQYSILKNIYFDFNQASFRNKTYEDMLLKLIEFMIAHPQATLKIVGHADDMGTKEKNLRVSQLRSQFIKEELVKAGISAERILVHFRGEEEPLASNDDDREGRELNRRAEIYVLMPEKD